MTAHGCDVCATPRCPARPPSGEFLSSHAIQALAIETAEEAVEGARVGPSNYTFRRGHDVIRLVDIPDRRVTAGALSEAVDDETRAIAVSSLRLRSTSCTCCCTCSTGSTSD